MGVRSKFIRGAIVLAFSTLAGFNAVAADKEDLAEWRGEMPIQDAWLRTHLPSDTLAYLRVPHPLGFFAAPKGNAFDQALRSTGNVKALQSIQGTLVENVLKYLPGFEESYVQNFANQLRSPIEVSLLLVPAPSVIVSMNLDIESHAGMEEMIAGVAIGGSNLSIAGQISDEGFGEIIGLPVPTAIHFDRATGRMVLQAGPAVVADQFSLLVDSLAANDEHKMQAMEKQIDASGHGFYMWIDAESALPAAQMFLDPEQLAELEETGLDKVRAAAFGWGVANGKGRMTMMVDMPDDGEREYLPYIKNKMSATAVGEPDAIFTLSIPTAEEFSRIEALALAATSEENRESWLEGKETVKNETGITVENVLNAIGPEVIGILDDAGDYVAIRLRDERLFDQFIKQASKVAGSAPIERKYRRKTFYQWTFTTDLDAVEDDEDASFGALAFILARQGEHLHWYRDGDFLYMAAIPQPLMDRVDAGADTSIETWLENQQRMDLTESVMGLTGSSEKLPRRIYYVYIELLQAIADISEAEFDIWSIPSATQAGLPNKGALGFAINFGDPYLSAELTFENNPLESIFSGDMTSIFAVGVLAAIAIPAYQDYTIRAEISQGLAEAAPVKAAVTEYYISEGEFPGPHSAAGMNDEVMIGGHTESIKVLAGTGTIVITYQESTDEHGGPVYLVPTPEDGVLTWTCSSALPDKMLPSACRENEPPDLESGGT